MGNAKLDLLAFIFFLILLGFAWVATGGPSRTTAAIGPFFQSPFTIGNPFTNPDVELPSINQIESGSQGESNPNSGESETNQTPPTQNPTKSFYETYFDTRAVINGSGDPAPSPYASSVTLSTGTAKNSKPESEYVIIQTSSSLKNNLTITGWTLESVSTGVKAKIGSAALIPFLGQVNSEVPIVISPKSKVYVTTSRSPNGVSFRVNSCTGYFEQFQNFSPALKKDCPSPEDEFLNHPELAGNDLCTDFVERLPSCELRLTSIPGNIGGACQNFVLNELSYSGCINAHKNDPGFYKNEWRVFLNRDQELWKNTHERIRLLDENGKLIAAITY